MLGKNLGHYRILEKLGAGGMGEVYVAEDTKLGRRVALKVLPPEMATDERLMRFEREVKAVAALDHPNIVTIYSVEEAEGIHFYTMQLVKGKTLTELIPKRGLPLNKFFETAIPLTDAVSAAHGKGIIHRDLKPDNLMLSDEGRLKILDFGLAKLKQEFAQEGISELPTQSPTQEGRILGTVAYMSPEQAEGKSIDHRSDIFSMGIILYEMATGERPFKGETTVSILSSIVKDKPTSATEINPALPHILGRIIRRCLVKDPSRRYQTALDLRNEVEELKQEVESGEVLDSVVPPSRDRKRFALGVIIGAAVVTAVAGAYLLLGPSRESSAPLVRSVTQITSDPGVEEFPSCRDGDIYLKRVGGERLFNLTEDSPDVDTQPAFSPDGEQIVFRSDRQGGGLFLMGATGESVRRLTDFGVNPAWFPDGATILFDTPSGEFNELWTVSPATGETVLLSEGGYALAPKASPEGIRIAYRDIDKGGQRDVWTVRADGSDPVRVTDDPAFDANPVWSPGGSYLYFSSDRGGSFNLWRVSIDEASGEVLGEPEPVTTPSAEAFQLAFARDGLRAVYTGAITTVNIQKIGLNTDAEKVVGEPIPVTQGSIPFANCSPSPDGEWITFTSSGTQVDIIAARVDGTGRRRLTDDPYRDRRPRWSPDGERIAFYSDRSGSYQIWSIRPDGSDLEQLTDHPDLEFWSPTWSPDGSRMVVSQWSGNPYIIDPDTPWSEQSPEALPPMSDTSEHFVAWSWSPDGKLLGGHWSMQGPEGRQGGIAIYSLESQGYEKLTEFGYGLVWLNDSRRLVFAATDKLSLLDSETDDVQELFAPPLGTVGNPTVSRDNRTLFFNLANTEADIWMLTLDEEQK
jgi:serine/threonine protein kinase